MDIVQLILAATPVLLLIVLLGFLKVPGDKSALITLAATLLIAVFGFDFSVKNTSLAFLLGALKAIFPILIIILMAIFSYNVLLFTKKMDVLKQQFSSISSDKCIQVLLLTWGFGGLLEGMAGFGTAVAIPAAILISLGFKPVFSAVASLIANSVATGFGAVGTPVVMLAKTIGIDPTDALAIQELSVNVVWQLAPLMFLIPFVLVFMTDSSMKALPKNIILSLLVGAVSLAVQYGAARYIGAETPAILGSLASIITIIAWGKLTSTSAPSANLVNYSASETLNAWSIYGFILLLIVFTSPLFMGIRTFLQGLVVTNIPLTFTDIVTTAKDAAGQNIIEATTIKVHKITWLTDAGVLLFLGTMLGGLIQGASFKDLFSLLGKTVIQLKKTFITVTCLIGLSTVMDMSSMIFVIGSALAVSTGQLYPIFAPAIGCLGTFLTGSDTSSNILFGKLQVTVADQIGADPSWLAAANTAGATGGKIISPQSIAVATSACNQQGKEGEIMKKALPFALAYIVIAGLMVYFFG